jgi:hypothetical protein
MKESSKICYRTNNSKAKVNQKKTKKKPLLIEFKKKGATIYKLQTRLFFIKTLIYKHLKKKKKRYGSDD